MQRSKVDGWRTERAQTRRFLINFREKQARLGLKIIHETSRSWERQKIKRWMDAPLSLTFFPLVIFVCYFTNILEELKYEFEIPESRSIFDEEKYRRAVHNGRRFPSYRFWLRFSSASRELARIQRRYITILITGLVFPLLTFPVILPISMDTPRSRLFLSAISTLPLALCTHN